MSFQFSPEHLSHVAGQLKWLDDGIAKHQGHAQLWELEYNKALVLLSCGRLAEGWKLFDRRFSQPGAKFAYEHFPLPRWNGESLYGKNVFLWLEQGVGDQIMCCSMLPDLLKAVGHGRITVIADRYMNKVLCRSFPTVRFHKAGDILAKADKNWEFDYQLSMSDLGLMFRTQYGDFPGTPFLKYDQSKAAKFRQKYAAHGKTIVGIGWSSLSKSTGIEKTMNLVQMAPILKNKDYVFVDLQYGDHDEELKVAKQAGLNIIHDDSVDQLCEMDDFFSQVAAMDMVISTSQTLVHVAGSIGVPAHCILPLGKGRLWYWFAEMSKSPWYKSLTLYRQKRIGDWTAPVSQVSHMLRQRQPMCLTA